VSIFRYLPWKKQLIEQSITLLGVQYWAVSSEVFHSGSFWRSQNWLSVQMIPVGFLHEKKSMI